MGGPSVIYPTALTGRYPQIILISHKRMWVDMRVTVPRVIILLVVLLVPAVLISYFFTSNDMEWHVFEWHVFLSRCINFFVLFLFLAFFVGAILFIFSRINRPKSVEGKIKKLAKLKEAGIITEEEFEARKHKLLDQL